MTRLKFCFSTFAVLIIFMGINSCVKDDLKNENGVDFFTDKRNIAPTIINGMLHFDTYAAFEDYMQELEDLEQDSSQIELAFQQLGVDLSQELLPNLTFFPVCLLREQQISGFISARKTEEDDINNALNAGDTSVFSIISEPYLKSVLNSNFSVHIGTRIFKFFENEGLLIILNNDWNTYYANVSKTTDQIISGPNMVFTSRDKNSWGELYEYNSNGEITLEKTYNGPMVTVAEAPLACDFSDALRSTDLGNGRIRIELPSNAYDIYEWTFEDGSIVTGNPLTIDCNQRTAGIVRLDVWMYDSSVPAGRRRICTGTIDYFCRCGERRQVNNRYQSDDAGGSGRAVRIEASLWLRAGEIGCRSNLFARGAFGIWFPMNWVHTTRGVCVDIEGNIHREIGSGTNRECLDVNIPLTTRCLRPGQANGTIQLTLPQAGQIFHDEGQLTSGHRARLAVAGTWFGFGVDVPRLVLE